MDVFSTACVAYEIINFLDRDPLFGLASLKTYYLKDQKLRSTPEKRIADKI